MFNSAGRRLVQGFATASITSSSSSSLSFCFSADTDGFGGVGGEGVACGGVGGNKEEKWRW